MKLNYNLRIEEEMKGELSTAYVTADCQDIG